MVKDKVREAIVFLKRCLENKGLAVSKIVLFGSQATGLATMDSDVDIIIISKDFEGRDILDRAQMTKEAEISTIKKFMIPFDIMTMTPDEFENGSSLVAEYARDGVVVCNGLSR